MVDNRVVWARSESRFTGPGTALVASVRLG